MHLEGRRHRVPKNEQGGREGEQSGGRARRWRDRAAAHHGRRWVAATTVAHGRGVAAVAATAATGRWRLTGRVAAEEAAGVGVRWRARCAEQQQQWQWTPGGRAGAARDSSRNQRGVAKERERWPRCSSGTNTKYGQVGGGGLATRPDPEVEQRLPRRLAPNGDGRIQSLGKMVAVTCLVNWPPPQPISSTRRDKPP